jgi:hypothetical protein
VLGISDYVQPLRARFARNLQILGFFRRHFQPGADP